MMNEEKKAVRIGALVDTVPYSCWQEFIMWLGIGVLLFCGCLVGRRYFNKVLVEIFEEGIGDQDDCR